MRLFRSLIYQFFLILSVATIGGSIILVAPFTSYRVISKLARYWGVVNLVALRVLCGLDFRVTELDQLGDEPAIVLCKHQSAWETIALRVIVPCEQVWVLKEELLMIPVFGSVLKRLGSIAINRADGRQAIRKVLKEGRAALDRGRWVVIFPEGTRVTPGTRKPYNIGGAVLAERTGYSVVPIAHNGGEFWGRRRLLKEAGTIDVVIGPRINSAGKTAREINDAVEDWIESTVARLSRPSL